MKRAIKIIFSLSLTILFLMTCFLVVISFFIAGWLHTYRTFTQKRHVAQIQIEQIESIDEFERFKLTYTPIKDQSALTKLFFDSQDEGKEFEQTKEYTMYGDHFEIGGEIIKFDDFWQLFNLKNIYKVTRIEGDFTDANKAKSLPNQKRSVYELNGGTDNYWKRLQKDEDKYDLFVDSVFGNFATKFVQDEPRTYNLYITEDGFVLNETD